MDIFQPTQIIKTTKKCSNVNIKEDNCKCTVEGFKQSNKKNKSIKYLRILMWILLGIIILLLLIRLFMYK
jgi:hypothetical protein